MNEPIWEPWFHGGKVVRIEGTEVDGVFIVDADVVMPAVSPESITLKLVPNQHPWDETVLAMRASVGKLV